MDAENLDRLRRLEAENMNDAEVGPLLEHIDNLTAQLEAAQREKLAAVIEDEQRREITQLCDRRLYGEIPSDKPHTPGKYRLIATAKACDTKWTLVENETGILDTFDNVKIEYRNGPPLPRTDRHSVEHDCFRGNVTGGPASVPMFVIVDHRKPWSDCALFWRPNRSGYTFQLDEAGRYSRDEAEAIHANRETDVPVPLALAEAKAQRHVGREVVNEVVLSRAR
jgi:hypothetical protein